MGTSTYDKDQVFDIAKYVEANSPLDEVVQMFMRVMDRDRWFAKAQWYAMGRMHYEAAPLEDSDGRDDEPGSAAGFAYLYRQMMEDFTDRRRPEALPLHTAWANYTGSLGGTIEP